MRKRSNLAGLKRTAIILGYCVALLFISHSSCDAQGGLFHKSEFFFHRSVDDDENRQTDRLPNEGGRLYAPPPEEGPPIGGHLSVGEPRICCIFIAIAVYTCFVIQRSKKA